MSVVNLASNTNANSVSGLNFYTAANAEFSNLDKENGANNEVGRWIGSKVGSAVGGTGGAAVGAVVCSAGALVCSSALGTAGAVAGGKLGGKIGDKASDFVAGKFADGYDFVADKFTDGYDYVADKFADCYDFVADKVTDGYDYVAEKLEDGYDYVADTAKSAYQKTKDLFGWEAKTQGESEAENSGKQENVKRAESFDETQDIIEKDFGLPNSAELYNSGNKNINPKDNKTNWAKDNEEIEAIKKEITKDAELLPGGSANLQMWRLKDGTTVTFRTDSKTGGATLDIVKKNGQLKIHKKVHNLKDFINVK